jgi:NTP pyrophosphatase (non-canonical NTP hydrolase)
MKTLSDLQDAIISERHRQGWLSETDINCTVAGIAEELGEFARALRERDPMRASLELGGIMIFCLGGLRILENQTMGVATLAFRAQDILEEIVGINAARPLRRGH